MSFAYRGNIHFDLFIDRRSCYNLNVAASAVFHRLVKLRKKQQKKQNIASVEGKLTSAPTLHKSPLS